MNIPLISQDTVASVLSDFNKTVSRLKTIAQKRDADTAKNREKISELEIQNKDNVAEATQALKVAEKIEALVS